MKIKNLLFNIVAGSTLALSISSCNYTGMGISHPNVMYELGRNDMEVSDQKSAEASQTKIIGIDFARLFKAESASISSLGYVGIDQTSSIPIVGSYITPTTVQNYALYNLISGEQGYDFVLYPRFEENTKGIPFIFTTTKSKVTAKLGKLK
ncbi:MAG: hypothetical protein MRY83_06735 [Flavobacteriales bacterium]|nr:hypothetical protein [Flavobacteriales bacterium]